MAFSVPVTLTPDRAKAALKDILNAFTLPDNVTKLDEAKDNAGNDMLKYMQLVFPVATQIQLEVIQNYGFPGDGEGLIQFSQAVRSCEKENQEVSQLNLELRSFLIPPMVLPSVQNSAS